MEKVLVVNSPLFRFKNPLYDEDSLPPIGLGHIATILQQNHIPVELIDAVAENIPLDDLIQLIISKSPTVIATNIFTTKYLLVRDLIEALANTSIRIIIGGLSTKTLYESIFTWNLRNDLDVVFGDGEYIVLDIVKRSVKEEPLKSEGNKRVFKVDSKSLYYVEDISKSPLDRAFFKNEPIKHVFGFTEANIVASRGCIYNCAFCAAAQSLNREFGIRERSANSITQELKDIVSDYPSVESVRILDDLFLKNKHTVRKSIDIFSQFNLLWRSMAHVMTFRGVSEDTMKELKASGCSELFIGIESGSPRVLKRIHKTHRIDLIKENLTKLLKVGIDIKGYFIYGFPEETEDDFKKTLELATYFKEQSLQWGSRFRTSVFQFRPYHGTELYHDIQAQLGQVPTVQNVAPNQELSDLVGRLQFNFHSGNYAATNVETVHKYIYLTTNLNSSNLFEPQL